MQNKDQSFDGIANKFERNIYGSSKGKLRHQILIDQLSPLLSAHSSQSILDLGGGTGVMAKTLLDWGHEVHLVDTSNDVLEHAKIRLSGYSKFSCELKSLRDVNPKGDYDWVICHAVLEWLDDPFSALSHIVKMVRPEGYLSLSVFNKDAALFSNALYGNFDYIAKGMKVKNQVRLNPQNPIAPKALLATLSDLKCEVDSVTGVRCFHDYLKQPMTSEDDYEKLLSLERQYNKTEPYCWLGRYLHIIARP